jgi:hydroxymethylbilane synthase
VPLAAYAEVEGSALRLRALVGNAATGEYVETEIRGPIAEAEAIAAEAVARLKANGALALLATA